MTADPVASSRIDATATAPPSRSQLWFYAFARALVAGFSHLYWQVRVEGREHIPKTGGFVLAPVHRSNIDTPLMGCVTRRRLRFMGKDSMWKYSWSGWLFTSLGGFPVERGTVDREALRRCEAAIRGGEPVVIFPEGTRKEGPRVENLFEGAAFVATRLGVPIIPVGIGGSERAMPRHAKFIKPSKVRIVVGPPLLPPPRQEHARGARRQAHELTEQLQTELQRLFDRAQQAAGTPNLR